MLATRPLRESAPRSEQPLADVVSTWLALTGVGRGIDEELSDDLQSFGIGQLGRRVAVFLGLVVTGEETKEGDDACRTVMSAFS